MSTIPLDLSNSVLTIQEDFIDFNNNTYQLYVFLPAEQENITYKKILDNHKETYYGINELSMDEWIVTGPIEDNGQYSLYRNTNVTSVPKTV